jgi:hypothetical protein
MAGNVGNRNDVLLMMARMVPRTRKNLTKTELSISIHSKLSLCAEGVETVRDWTYVHCVWVRPHLSPYDV